MTLIQWDPDGKEDYTIFTGVVTIDPSYDWLDETVNAWVVATSPNAEAALIMTESIKRTMYGRESE